MYIVFDMLIITGDEFVLRSQCTFAMESDDIFINSDWDPCYLSLIFDESFDNMSELWNEEYVPDSVILQNVDEREVYSPLVEDISLDDDELHKAVEEIESE